MLGSTAGRSLLAAFAAALALAGFSAPAGAAEVTVTSPLDEFVDNSTCSLREAISAANTNLTTGEPDCPWDTPGALGNDTIELAAGIYKLEIGAAGDDANLSGDLDINTTGPGNSLIIDGAGPGATAIRGDDAPVWADRILHFVTGADALEISDLEISGGRASTGEDGGGIYDTAAGDFALISVELTDNHAGDGAPGSPGTHGGDGGGIAGSIFTLTDSVLSGNTAGDGGTGTGMGAAGGQGGTGGAIALGAQAEVIRSTIEGNSAGDGGPAALPHDITAGAGGFAGSGGGIASFADGVELIDSLVVDNHAGDAGAGNTLAPTRHGGQGGGVAGNFTIRNSTIYANDSGSTPVDGNGGDGAGVLGTGSVISSTITANNSGTGVDGPGAGSGIFASNLTIANSIVHDNEATDCSGAPLVDEGNNIGNDASCVFFGFANLDPGLDPAGPESNGGPTETIELLAGSPAIDFVPTGDCTVHPLLATPLTADQRGLPRPSGVACDTGAFEFQYPPPIAPPIPNIPVPTVASTVPAAVPVAKKCPKGKKLKKVGKKRKCVKKKKKRKK